MGSSPELLTFEQVARLPQFGALDRWQVRRHLLSADKELGGRLLLKTVGPNGRTHYRVTMENLKKLVPQLFGEAEEKRDLDLEERVRVLEEASERQARKLGELRLKVEELEDAVPPCR